MKPIPHIRSARLLRRAARQLLAAASAAMLTITLAGDGYAAPAKAKAPELVGSMRRSIALVRKSLKSSDPRLAGAKKQAQEPFFAALKKANRNVKDLAKVITAKDAKTLFKVSDRTGQSVRELETAYALSGVSVPGVSQGMKRLVESYNAFRRSFGKEGARRSKGGALSPQETKQASDLAGKYRAALPQLQKARTAAAKNPAAAAELGRMIDALNALLSTASGTVSVDVFYELVAFEEYFVGSWYATSSYVSRLDPAAYRTAFAPVDTFVVDVSNYATTVEASFAIESSEYWSYVEETTVETTWTSELEISEAEVTTFEAEIEEIDVEAVVDEYDVTLGDEDDAFLDHDDDGTLDAADADDDGDGTPDASDADDDGDGLADFTEEDSDDDGEPDAIDEDDDNDGLDDVADKDDDGDGAADEKDDDEDNDNDGKRDDVDPDDDNDGTPDARDEDDDGDGVDDDVDADDDNDGEPDAADADHDSDGDGKFDDVDADDDNDGTPDDRDADDDNDGTADAEDEDNDTDGDGTADEADTDDDGDGTPDAADGDDDGDGEPDAAEDDAGDEGGDEGDAADEGDDGGDEGADDGGDEGADEGGDEGEGDEGGDDEEPPARR